MFICDWQLKSGGDVRRNAIGDDVFRVPVWIGFEIFLFFLRLHIGSDIDPIRTVVFV